MKSNHSSKFLYLIFITFTLFVAGCAVEGPVKFMQVVEPGQEILKPEPGKALVIFIRPQTLGYKVQSSVFEVVGDECNLVGIVAAKKRVAYMVEPGEHLFTVIGESADFMYADLEAGKTYYAEVTPRMGAWKARFSLRAVPKAEAESDKFNKNLSTCKWVKPNDESFEWASSNMQSIQQKRTAAYERWMARTEESRPKIHPEYGI